MPSARDGGLFERRRQLAPGGPTVAGYPRESTPGRVPWSRARIPAQEALERHTGDPLLDALVQASTGHNAARRPPRPGWSASELRPTRGYMSASAVAAAGPPDGRQSLPSGCCRGESPRQLQRGRVQWRARGYLGHQVVDLAHSEQGCALVGLCLSVCEVGVRAGGVCG